MFDALGLGHIMGNEHPLILIIKSKAGGLRENSVFFTF